MSLGFSPSFPGAEGPLQPAPHPPGPRTLQPDQPCQSHGCEGGAAANGSPAAPVTSAPWRGEGAPPALLCAPHLLLSPPGKALPAPRGPPLAPPLPGPCARLNPPAPISLPISRVFLQSGTGMNFFFGPPVSEPSIRCQDTRRRGGPEGPAVPDPRGERGEAQEVVLSAPASLPPAGSLPGPPAHSPPHLPARAVCGFGKAHRASHSGL